MTESPRPDDRLLDAAAAIARGEPVDWAQLPVDTDADTTTVVAQLRALEGLSQQSEPVPGAWGPFTILGEIGHGSFGTVYRAIDPNLNIELALKVVRPRQPITDGDFTRALTEARILAQINHPHVVRVFQVQRIDQEVGLSMELVKGRTLHNIVKTDGPLSANESMLLGIDLCQRARRRARRAAAPRRHQGAQRHASRGRTDRPHGLRRRRRFLKRDQPPPDRRVTGTPLYLAPELFDGGVRTRLSDIYSVGVLLYHAATRGYPVEGSTREEVEQQHASRTPRRLLRDIGPHLPDAFISVVERATARRPEDRYQSAGELEAALRQALRREEPVPLPGPSWFRRRGCSWPAHSLPWDSPTGCGRACCAWRRLGTTSRRPVQRRRDPCHAVSNRSGVLSRTRWRLPSGCRPARPSPWAIGFRCESSAPSRPTLHRQ